MLREQINDLNIKKVLCKKSGAIIYLLSDGRVFKRFLFEEVDRYSDKGISLENKILEGERLKEHTEFYGPLSAVYRKSTFVGYTMDFNKGKNLIKYFDSLKYKYSQSNLKFCASRYKKLESVVKKGHTLGVVFPDLCTASNIFISRIGHFSLTDYDGFQIDDYPTFSISSIIYDRNKVFNPKFYNNGLFTEELDKYSLMILFLQELSSLNLSLIDTINPATNEILTTRDLADYINLDDEEIIRMIEDTVSIDREGVYVSEVADAIASKYDLIVCNNEDEEYSKILVKK